MVPSKYIFVLIIKTLSKSVSSIIVTFAVLSIPFVILKNLQDVAPGT